ncbi:MAG: hypothetical protein ABIG95_05035 [Candidatus Woesearchaeota archaeon]
MTRGKLKPKILVKLMKKLDGKMTEQAIRTKLSKLRAKHHITLNAAAEVLAKEHGFNVTGLLDKEDMDCLKDKSVEKIKININQKKPNKMQIIQFVKFETSNKFLKKHLEEINRCYTFNCCTAAFILIRKIIENLIVEIAKNEFPDKTSEQKKIYLDLGKGRIHDLSVLIKNLRKEAQSCDPEKKKLILRILQLSEQFKDDANDKTHSLYHICGKKELKEKNPQEILDLIEAYFNEYITKTV